MPLLLRSGSVWTDGEDGAPKKIALKTLFCGRNSVWEFCAKFKLTLLGCLRIPSVGFSKY